MPDTPTKAQQEAEARDRAALNDNGPPSTDYAPEPLADDPAPRSAQPPAEPRAPADPINDNEPPEPKRISPGDEARMRIAEKMKAARAARDNPDDFTGDFRDPTMTYGEFGRPPPPPEPQDAPILPTDAGLDPPAEPRKFKIKVRHEERELTEEEVLALARKAAAGDDYFEESKRILNEAKAIRDAAARPPQGVDDLDYDGLDEPSPNDASAPQRDDFEGLVEAIQYGDQKEAAQKLRAAIESGAKTAATQGALELALEADLKRSTRSVARFRDENLDLANDGIARAALAHLTHSAVREDLLKVGVPEEKLPSDPNALLRWHAFYRVQDHDVRDMSAILSDAKAKFLQYRGTPSASPPGHQGVHVNVDREARRQQIQPQPQRTAAPPAQRQQQPVVNDVERRRMAIRKMKAARGQNVA